MRKIIGIIGAVLLAFNLLSNGFQNNTVDFGLSLAELASIKSANAEEANKRNLPTPVLCPDQQQYYTNCVSGGIVCINTRCY